MDLVPRIQNARQGGPALASLFLFIASLASNLQRRSTRLPHGLREFSNIGWKSPADALIDSR